MVIPFQYILRIYVGEQTRAYYLNISAAAKPLKGNDKLWPDRYYFIPYDDDVDDLQEFVKYLNFAVFGHPGILLCIPETDRRSSTQNFPNFRQSEIRKGERIKGISRGYSGPLRFIGYYSH